MEKACLHGMRQTLAHGEAQDVHGRRLDARVLRQDLRKNRLDVPLHNCQAHATTRVSTPSKRAVRSARTLSPRTRPCSR
jgi:hypothetical protein